MDCIDINTRLIDLTLGDLLAAVRRQFDEAISDEAKRRQEQERSHEHYAPTLKDFAKIMGVSESTVHKWKNKGLLDDAIYGHGHRLMVNVERAKQCLKISIQPQN